MTTNERMLQAIAEIDRQHGRTFEDSVNTPETITSIGGFLQSDHVIQNTEASARRASFGQDSWKAPEHHVVDPFASDSAAAAPTRTTTEGGRCVCGNEGLFDCTGCNQQTYCCSQCQRADWPTHSLACKAAVAAGVGTKARERSLPASEEDKKLTSEPVGAPVGPGTSEIAPAARPFGISQPSPAAIGSRAAPLHRSSTLLDPVMGLSEDGVIGGVAHAVPAHRPRLSQTSFENDEGGEASNIPAARVRLESGWRVPRLGGKPRIAPTETLITVAHVGRRVMVKGLCEGTLRFVGTPHAAQAGTWLGVELDHPVGKNNGCFAGEQHFLCAENHGVFISLRSRKVSLTGTAPAAAWGGAPLGALPAAEMPRPAQSTPTPVGVRAAAQPYMGISPAASDDEDNVITETDFNVRAQPSAGARHSGSAPAPISRSVAYSAPRTVAVASAIVEDDEGIERAPNKVTATNSSTADGLPASIEELQGDLDRILDSASETDTARLGPPSLQKGPDGVDVFARPQGQPRPSTASSVSDTLLSPLHIAARLGNTERLARLVASKEVRSCIALTPDRHRSAGWLRPHAPHARRALRPARVRPHSPCARRQPRHRRGLCWVDRAARGSVPRGPLDGAPTTSMRCTRLDQRPRRPPPPPLGHRQRVDRVHHNLARPRPRPDGRCDRCGWYDPTHVGSLSQQGQKCSKAAQALRRCGREGHGWEDSCALGCAQRHVISQGAADARSHILPGCQGAHRCSPCG
eukprot:m.112721 g.112721  ORF g.112721 m.112721 type:complete len:748 (+) comp9121_c0_seq7:50-2293(+)